MPKTEKSVAPINLAKYTAYVNDTDPNSRYFNLGEVPDVLAGGKNAFLINGSKELNPTTDVKIEIIDSQGNTIFLQPIKNYQEGLARVISIEIYEDTPAGQATLTIMGELRRTADGVPVPPGWVGKYNVKYTKPFTVHPTAINSTKVRLYNRPDISVSELLIPYYTPTTASFVTLSGSGVLRDVKTSVFPNLPVSQQRPDLAPINTIDSFYLGNFPYSFVRDMEGGTVLAPAYNYTGSIIRVFNSGSLQLSTGSLSGFAITPTPISLSYQPGSSFGGTALTKSYAEVTLSKLTTFSGDIARARVYAKSQEVGAIYQLIADHPLTGLNLMLTASLQTGQQGIPFGVFGDSTILSNYWQGGTCDSQHGYAVSPLTMSLASNRIIEGVYNSGSAFAYLDTTGSLNPAYFFGLSSPLNFTGQMEYTFIGTLACYKSDPNFDAKCEVYLSGSAFATNNPLGTLVQTFDCSSGQNYVVFDKGMFNFNALGDGTADLNFVVYGGQWHFADIEIDSAEETGFNPDEVTIIAPLTGRRFETLTFKAELLDPNSNILPILIESAPKFFDGGNIVLKGDDHRIEGEMKIIPSGANPALTSIRMTTAGYIDTLLNPTSGSAIFIGSGSIFNANTPFFVGTDLSGSAQISLGDKLWGYTDPITKQFVLKIAGTIIIGSGSSFTDVRTLLPHQLRDVNYDRVQGNVLSMKDVRGTYAVTAGDWNSQIARMGNYTRGVDGYVPHAPVSVPGVIQTIDPFTTGSLILYASQSIALAANQQIYNNTLYGDMNVGLVEGGIVSGMYLMTYVLEVITSWDGFLTGSSQELNNGSNIYITQQGSFSPDPILKYPLFVPLIRTSNTLYVSLKLTVTTTPQPVAQ